MNYKTRITDFTYSANKIGHNGHTVYGSSKIGKYTTLYHHHDKSILFYWNPLTGRIREIEITVYGNMPRLIYLTWHSPGEYPNGQPMRALPYSNAAPAKTIAKEWRIKFGAKVRKII